MFKFLLLTIAVTGLASSAKTPKIVNGEDADIASYPYQISIQLNGEHSCGGSVLTSTKILTAAHCVEPFTPDQLSVRAGSSIREQGGQVKQVAEFVMHPKWNTPIFDNDVAVITLTEPLVLNDVVQTIALATTDNVPVGAYATVTGWGVTENGTRATILQELQVPRISVEVCTQHNPFLFNKDTMVCYGGEPDNLSCSNDSGGPLVYSDVQVGIVSFGPVPCKGTTPVNYARVDHFLEFIQGLI